MSAQCWWIVAVFGAVLLAAINAQEAIPPTCESPVFCRGELLKTLQLANPPLHVDSKTLVDKKLKKSSNETLQDFSNLMASTGNNPTRDQLVNFEKDHFENGDELEVIFPSDWVESPPVLYRIADPALRQWAKDLIALWKNLTRQVHDDVRVNSDRYSLIYIPNPFVIPGGRFKEPYYWDTYWIVTGLLLSNMSQTVKGIIENFVYMQENYGIVPNGGRVYYLQRSQPPLLIPMVANYYRHTNDMAILKNNILSLEKEFQFWMDNRTVQVTKNGKSYTLARYYAVSEGPRPESYREDYEEAQRDFDNDERRQEFYVDMKSGAESGWDFSSRWFIKNATNKGKLTDIHTRYIIPVELNAIIYWNAQSLSKFHTILGNICKSQEYAKIAAEWKEAVTAVLWDENEGSWFDYDISNNIPRKYFYPSNIAPLWTKCYDETRVAVIAQKVVDYIERENIRYYLGGIPTSLNVTGEQWDLPNAWPPLQSIIIQGLQETNQPNATSLALEFAKHWVGSNYEGYKESSEMYEKYDAENPGKYGGGGEYTVQSGFGWTNGVILELLASYGHLLTANNNNINNTIVKRSLLDILKSSSAK